MSGRSSWCFGSDHPGCRFSACTCACHERAVAEHPAEPPAGPAAAQQAAPAAAVLPATARPVPGGTQVELGFPDSIDGSTDDVATVSLELRGQVYEVDLSRRHREALQAALAPFIAVARRG